MTEIRKHRPVTLANLIAAANARGGKQRGPIPVAPVARVMHITRDAQGVRPVQYPRLAAGEIDLVAEAEARTIRGGAALLYDVLTEDLDDHEKTVPAYFPQPGLGSRSKDPVVAAEYITRMYAAHAPGGTQNR